MSQFLTYVDTKFNTKVLAIRSNNAPNLCEGDMKSFFLRKGIIIHSTSCPNTPQQNGVVEGNIGIY